MWEAYDYKTVAVVGVTFKNKDGNSRQEIIRELYEYYGHDLFLADVKLRKRTYKGDPAVAVYVDDKQVGFLSKELAYDLAWQKEEFGYRAIVTGAWIVGGPEDDFGDEDEEECDIDENNRFYGIRLDLEIGEVVREESYKPAAYKTPVLNKGKNQRARNQRPATKKYNPVPRYKNHEKVFRDIDENDAGREPWETNSKKKRKKGIVRIVLGALYALYGFQHIAVSATAALIYIFIGTGVIVWGIVDNQGYK